MRLRVKFFMAFLSITLLTIMVAGISFWGFENIRKTTDHLVLVNHRINELSNLFGKELAHSRRAEKEFFIFPNNEEKQLKYVNNWKKSYGTMKQFLNELEKLLKLNNNQEILANVYVARDLMRDSEAEFGKVVTKFKQTKSYDVVNKAEYGSFKKKTHILENIAVILADYGLASVKENRVELQATQNNVQKIMLVISSLTILWSIFLSVFMSKRITAAVGYLIEVSNKICQGNFEAEITIDRKDELGDLAKAFKRMQKSFKMLFKRYKVNIPKEK